MAVRLTRGKEVLYAEDAAVGGGGGNQGGGNEKKEATPRGPQRPKAMVHEVESAQSLCEHYRGALLAEEQRAEDLSQENHYLKQLLAKVHRGEVSPKEFSDVVAADVAGWVGWCWPVGVTSGRRAMVGRIRVRTRVRPRTLQLLPRSVSVSGNFVFVRSVPRRESGGGWF